MEEMHKICLFICDVPSSESYRIVLKLLVEYLEINKLLKAIDLYENTIKLHSDIYTYLECTESTNICKLCRIYMYRNHCIAVILCGQKNRYCAPNR